MFPLHNAALIWLWILAASVLLFILLSEVVDALNAHQDEPK